MYHLHIVKNGQQLWASEDPVNLPVPMIGTLVQRWPGLAGSFYVDMVYYSYYERTTSDGAQMMITVELKNS